MTHHGKATPSCFQLVEIQLDEVAALEIAIGNAVGLPHEGPLTALLRRLAPGSQVLARLDALRALHDDGL